MDYEAQYPNRLTVLRSAFSKFTREAELDALVERTFEGSIPAFIAAFSRSKKLSDDEVKQLQEMIDNYKG